MRINKCIPLIFTGVLLAQLSFGQITQVRFEQLDGLQKIEKRPVVVFLHTSWCKYCGTMKNTTFKNDKVINQLNQKFYFISLDAEEKQDIQFRGYTFKYKPTGANTGVNELAEQLGTINGELSYPSICFLNAKYEIIYQHNSYLSAKSLSIILQRLETQL
ncbi:MAG TPA: thioredoxin family protein [Segetibacter sp.]|jgi:thioredoxin-related protein|nr:thioredoxin family protein [Segetibacter sp.]